MTFCWRVSVGWKNTGDSWPVNPQIFNLVKGIEQIIWQCLALSSPQ